MCVGPGSVPQGAGLDFNLVRETFYWYTLYSVSTCTCTCIFFKASQPRGRASGSRAYERHRLANVHWQCMRENASFHSFFLFHLCQQNTVAVSGRVAY